MSKNMSKSNCKREQEKIKIINSLNEELKQIDFLNLMNNYFSYTLNYIYINKAKNFIKEFKVKYENLELFLQELNYNENLSLLMDCNIYDFYINDFIFHINEEGKKRLEDYIEKLNLKEKLESQLSIKNTEKRSKI